MTNDEIYQAALTQSALDTGCRKEDFLKEENIVVHSVAHPGARRYLTLPFSCNLVSYGSNIVASVDPAFEAPVKAYIDRYAVAHCFETPNMHILNDFFTPYGMKVCFMAEYWLPDVTMLSSLSCEYETRILKQADFAPLYRSAWSNALCEKRKELDLLGVGAYDGEALVGLAACSADCETMWQIGVDVLPGYLRKGIASALTSRLAVEILQRGIVPFYCCAWSNIASARNAIRSGFRPAWVELTLKPDAFVAEMNGILPSP